MARFENRKRDANTPQKSGVLDTDEVEESGHLLELGDVLPHPQCRLVELKAVQRVENWSSLLKYLLPRGHNQWVEAVPPATDANYVVMNKEKLVDDFAKLRRQDVKAESHRQYVPER